MTVNDGKYPNKKDLEPKVTKKGNQVGPTDELPLSDPADSNFTHEFRENEQHPADTKKKTSHEAK